VDTGFPKGNATNLESRALSGHGAHDLMVNLTGKRSSREADAATLTESEGVELREIKPPHQGNRAEARQREGAGTATRQ
jgi:hypothetical protein